MINFFEVASVDEKKLRSLAQRFQIHDMVVEDCLNRDQRPKLDDYADHKFLVWFCYYQDKIYEIQIIILQDTIILVPHEQSPVGEAWSKFLNFNSEYYSDVWHACYALLDRLTDITWSELRLLYRQIDDFEQNLFKKEVKPQDLIKLKRRITDIELSISHLPSVASQAQNLHQAGTDLNWKLRDLHDHCERINRTLAMYRGQTTSTIDLYWGLQSNKMNQQIKKLTLLASIGFPLSFWSSFWGMNFDIIPFNNSNLFYIAIVIMLLSVAINIYFLIKKGIWHD
ncbi:MAG: CorA family divalent cation transporter [Pseudobdellovibrio sp.]